jgi:hypothetical protein
MPEMSSDVGVEVCAVAAQSAAKRSPRIANFIGTFFSHYPTKVSWQLCGYPGTFVQARKPAELGYNRILDQPWCVDGFARRQQQNDLAFR